MSAEVAQTDSPEDREANMREYTFEELSAYLEHFYEREHEFGIGGPYTDEVDEVAFVSTDDDGLYAELQGAGFRIAFPENADDKTRFYVMELEEPMFRSFVEELNGEEGEVDG